MVRGHEYVKMSTSVIDYIFRDLAISYLKRTELGQIKPEDLLATGTKNGMGGEDRPRQEKTGAGANRAAVKTTGPQAGNFGAAPGGGGGGPAEAAAEQNEALKIAQARIKGYEGDPCPACGSFTLVRRHVYEVRYLRRDYGVQ
jgi:ribonucleoside-diphosphate reductase alpha chain